jgi:hypothetical protein
MHGKQITAYVGAELDPRFRRPIGADRIVKSWAPTQKKAEAKKREMEREHGGIVQIS